MKKINKLMTLALAALALVSIESCSKTQFQAANLVGTWSMTSAMEESTSKEIYNDDPTIDDETLSFEQTISYNYTGSGNATGTVSSTELFDATGVVKSEVSEYDVTGETAYGTFTTTLNDNTSTTGRDTVNYTTSKTIVVEFSKDKTFTYTSTVNTENSNVDENVFRTRTNVSSNKDVTIYKGSWAFIGMDKNQDFKNNERIGLWFDNANTTSTNTQTTTYVDKDPADAFDFDNETYVTENISDDNVSSTDADMVWEMVEGTAKEMKVTYMYESATTGTASSTYTVGGTSTSSTSTSNNTESSINTVTFAK